MSGGDAAGDGMRSGKLARKFGNGLYGERGKGKAGVSDLLPSSREFEVSKVNKRGKRQVRKFRIAGDGITNTNNGKVKWNYPREKILDINVSRTRRAAVDLEVIHTYTLHCKTSEDARAMVATCGAFGFGTTPEVAQEAERARRAVEMVEEETAAVAEECARLEAELRRMGQVTHRRRGSTTDEADAGTVHGMRMSTGRNVSDDAESEGDDDDDDSSHASGSDTDEDDDDSPEKYLSLEEMRDRERREMFMMEQERAVIAMLNQQRERAELLSVDPESALRVPASLLPQPPPAASMTSSEWSMSTTTPYQPAAPCRISTPPRSPTSPPPLPPPPPPEALM